MDAATTIVYGRHALVATAGQALAHDSCGAGAFCHSARAEGDNRVGAPRGLDFDMIPEPNGWHAMVDRRASVWDAIAQGAMPPVGMGARLVADGAWYFDLERTQEADRLPPLKTNAGRRIFRNWLACDAPIVEDTIVSVPRRQPASVDVRLPDAGEPTRPTEQAGMGQDDDRPGGEDTLVEDKSAQVQADQGDPLEGALDDHEAQPDPKQGSDWGAVFDGIVAPNCAIAPCHDGTVKAGGLDMSDKCGAYVALLESGPCGRPRVEPGAPESLLLEKLREATPACGGRMPVIGPLMDSEIDQIAAWVLAGAEAADCR